MSEDTVPEKEKFVPQHVKDGGRDYAVEGNDVSGYIGVSPEYMTYANETDKPMLTDAERLQHTDQYDHLIDNVDDEGNPRDVESDVDEDDVEETDDVEKEYGTPDTEIKEDEKSDETQVDAVAETQAVPESSESIASSDDNLPPLM